MISNPVLFFMRNRNMTEYILTPNGMRQYHMGGKPCKPKYVRK